LGPLLFILYTADLISLIRDVFHHFCTLTTLRCTVLVNPSRSMHSRRSSLECIGVVSNWMRSNRLQLNSDKTEVLWCTTGRRQHQLPSTALSIDVIQVSPVTSVRNLGIVKRVYMSKLAANVRISPNYSRFQSAYRRGHSTETALLRILNDINCAADKNYRTTLLQLDLSSAFDTLDTSALLRRLRFTYVISVSAFNWVSSYLVCRSQSVRVRQKQSSSTVCEYSVAQ